MHTLTLTLARHAGVFSVSTVVCTQRLCRAVQEARFSSRAADVIQPDGGHAAWSKVRAAVGSRYRAACVHRMQQWPYCACSRSAFRMVQWWPSCACSPNNDLLYVCSPNTFLTLFVNVLLTKQKEQTLRRLTFMQVQNWKKRIKKKKKKKKKRGRFSNVSYLQISHTV